MATINRKYSIIVDLTPNGEPLYHIECNGKPMSIHLIDTDTASAVVELLREEYVNGFSNGYDARQMDEQEQRHGATDAEVRRYLEVNGMVMTPIMDEDERDEVGTEEMPSGWRRDAGIWKYSTSSGEDIYKQHEEDEEPDAWLRMFKTGSLGREYFDGLKEELLDQRMGSGNRRVEEVLDSTTPDVRPEDLLNCVDDALADRVRMYIRRTLDVEETEVWMDLLRDGQVSYEIREEIANGINEHNRQQTPTEDAEHTRKVRRKHMADQFLAAVITPELHDKAEAFYMNECGLDREVTARYLNSAMYDVHDGEMLRDVLAHEILRENDGAQSIPVEEPYSLGDLVRGYMADQAQAEDSIHRFEHVPCCGVSDLHQVLGNVKEVLHHAARDLGLGIMIDEDMPPEQSIRHCGDKPLCMDSGYDEGLSQRDPMEADLGDDEAYTMGDMEQYMKDVVPDRVDEEGCGDDCNTCTNCGDESDEATQKRRADYEQEQHLLNMSSIDPNVISMIIAPTNNMEKLCDDGWIPYHESLNDGNEQAFVKLSPMIAGELIRYVTTPVTTANQYTDLGWIKVGKPFLSGDEGGMIVSSVQKVVAPYNKVP